MDLSRGTILQALRELVGLGLVRVQLHAKGRGGSRAAGYAIDWARWCWRGRRRGTRRRAW
jgi:hypothetical protein